jgi:AAA+ superfamily predicted ATPase
LPLEDAIFRSYFAEHIVGVLPLSKENIKILAPCLEKMPVLDPRNRAHAHELLLDPWLISVESLALTP